MAAIPITAVFGTQAKVLLVPLDRPAAERGQAIHQGVQSAFGLDHHDITITATIPAVPGSVAGSSEAVLATTPQPLDAVLESLCVGAVLIVTAQERVAVVAGGGVPAPDGSVYTVESSDPVVALDGAGKGHGLVGFAAMADPRGELVKCGLDVPESDELGRVFVPGAAAGSGGADMQSRPLVLSDETKTASGERQVAGSPVSTVLEAVLGRAMQLMRVDVGLCPQAVAWRPVRGSTGSGATGRLPSRVTVLGSPDWHKRPGGVMVVFAGAGAPPGVWSRRLSLYGGLRLGTSLGYIAQAMQRDMGVVLVDAFGYFDSSGAAGGAEGDRLGIAGFGGSNPPAAVQDDAASLSLHAVGAKGGPSGAEVLRARAIGRARRALRGVMQAMEGGDGSATGTGSAVSAGAWQRVVIVAHAEGCEIALEALAAEGVRTVSPLKAAARGGVPGGPAPVEAASAVIGGVGCEEDADSVAALNYRRVGAIAMLEPSHKAEDLAGEVWRLLIERGVAWVAATPGMKLATPTAKPAESASASGSGSGSASASASAPAPAQRTAVVGNIDVEAMRSRIGCGVIALKAPRLKAAIDAHKQWVSEQAEAATADTAASKTVEAEEDEDDATEILLLRSVLATGGGKGGGKIGLRAALWRTLTPHRAVEAVWQLVDTIKATDIARAPALSGRALRSQWASITKGALSSRPGTGGDDTGAGVGAGAGAGSLPQGRPRRSSALWAVARGDVAGTSPLASPSKRRGVVGGVESTEALQKASASLGSALPASARVAAGVAAFVEAALGGDVSAALGHKARRKSSSVSSAASRPESERAVSRGDSASALPTSRDRRDSASSPDERKAWFQSGAAAKRAGSAVATQLAGALKEEQEAEAPEVEVPPLPAPWSQRATEAAALLLENLTDVSVWGKRPKSVRKSVQMYQAASGLPGAMGVAAVDAPPGLVLSVLQDLEARKVIDTRVASTDPVAINVAREAGGGRLAVSHTKLKAMSMAISARDVVSLTWWTIDEAGRILLATASLPMDEASGLGAGSKGAIVPDAEGASLSIPASGRGFTRAFLAVAGWVIEPAPSVQEAAALPRLSRADVSASIERLRSPYRPQKRRQTAPARACRVTFLMRTNPGGGAPLGIVRGFVIDEALAVANMRSVIEKRYPSPSRMPSEVFEPVSTAAEIGSSPKTPPRKPVPPQRHAQAGQSAGSLTDVDETAFSDSDEPDGDEADGDELGDGKASRRERVLPADTEETFDANAGGTCPWLPGEEPPTDVTGVWKLCVDESDGLKGFLAAMGVPSAARDAAAAASVAKTTIAYEGPSLRIDDVTDFGTSTQRLLPDGHSRAAGRDRATLITAWYAPGPGIGKALVQHRALKKEAAAARALAEEEEAAKLAASRAEEEAKKKHGASWWFGSKGEAQPQPQPQQGAAGPAAAPGGSAQPPAEAGAKEAAESEAAEADAEAPADSEKGSPGADVDSDLVLPASEQELWQALPESLGRHRGYGVGAPCLRVRTRLPSGRGLVLEERVLCSRTRMRCVSVLVRRGRVRAYMVRYYLRAPDGKRDMGERDSVIDEIEEEQETEEEEEEEGNQAEQAGAGGDEDETGAGDEAGTSDADLEEAVMPWIEAARRREDAAILRAAAAGDARSPMALIAAAVMPPCNIAGTWVMDREASETNESMLRAWGHGPGKAASTATKATEIGLVVSIRQTSATLEYEERAEKGAGSRRRGLKRELVLDGRENLIFSASDRSHMASRAVIAPGDGTDDYTGYGDGAASIVVINYLPQGMGETIEVRRLLAPDRLEQLLLVVRDSREVARIRRVFSKKQTAAEAIVAESESEELRRMRRQQAAPRDAALGNAQRQGGASTAGGGGGGGGGGDDDGDLGSLGDGFGRSRDGRSRPAAMAAAPSSGSQHRSRLSSRATFLFDPKTDTDGAVGASKADAGASATETETEAAAAASAVADDDSPVEVPQMTPPADLTGVWKVDNDRSESLEPLLKAMGVPWMLRGMASRVDVTSTLTMPQKEKGPLGRATSLTITDSSSYGDATQELSLDGVQRDEIGFDGKPMQRTVSLVLPWEEGAVADGSTPAWLVAAKARANFDGMGTGAPVVRTKVVLEGGAINIDERRLLEPGLLELRTTFVKGSEQPVTVRRLLYRLEEKDPVAGAASRIQARTKERKAEHKAVLAKLRPERAAAAGGVAGGADDGDAEDGAAEGDTAGALVAAPESFAEQMQLQSPGPAVSADGSLVVLLAAAELNEDDDLSELLGEAEEDGEAVAGGSWVWREKRIAAAIGRWSCAVLAVSATAETVSSGADGDQRRALLRVVVSAPRGAVRAGPSSEQARWAVGTLPPQGEEGLGVDEELCCAAYVPPPSIRTVLVVGPGRSDGGPATLVCLSLRHVGGRLGKIAVLWRGEHRVPVTHRDAASSTVLVAVPAQLVSVDAGEFSVVSNRPPRNSQARRSSSKGSADALLASGASAPAASGAGAADA